MSNYEIFTDEESPYGPIRAIRATPAEIDGRHVFSTFTQAKRELVKILQADAENLQEQLLAVRYNLTDVRRTRLRDIKEIREIS